MDHTGPTGTKGVASPPIRCGSGEYCAICLGPRCPATSARRCALSIALTARPLDQQMISWRTPPAFAPGLRQNAGQIAVAAETISIPTARRRGFLRRWLNLSHRDSAEHRQAMTRAAATDIPHLIRTTSPPYPKGGTGLRVSISEPHTGPCFGPRQSRRG